MMAGFTCVVVFVGLISAAGAYNVNVLTAFEDEMNKAGTDLDMNMPSDTLLSKTMKRQFQESNKQAKDSQSGCNCLKATYTCGCCLHMKAEKIKLNDTGCVNISYLPDQYGISLTFSLDGKIILNETVSARNPPPLCLAVPYLKHEASLCIDFYNLDISKSSFSGCVKVEARLLHLLVEDFDLGCFKIPLRPGWQSSHQVALTSWINDIQNLAGKRRQVLFL